MECARHMRVALGEIRAARREMRAAQAEADRLELAALAACQTALQHQQKHDAGAAPCLPDPWIAAAAKSRPSERNTEKRRSLSLRGREPMAQVSREMAEKLSEQETRLKALQRRSASTEPRSASRKTHAAGKYAAPKNWKRFALVTRETLACRARAPVASPT